MIGQENIKSQIKKWSKAKSFPRFIVITQRDGWGKRTLANELCSAMGVTKIDCSCDIDSVREVIKQAYTITISTAYIFANAHKMSLNAKNALLKITEEPPNNAHFILTAPSMSMLLETLRSRCVELHMKEYSFNELYEYEPKFDEYSEFCECPGDIERVRSVDKQKMTDYCNTLFMLFCNPHKLYSGIPLLNGIKYTDDDNGVYPLDNVLIGLKHIILRAAFSAVENGTEGDLQGLTQAITKLAELQHNLVTRNLNKKSAVLSYFLSLIDIGEV